MKPIAIAALIAMCVAGPSIAQNQLQDPKTDPNVPPPTVQSVPLVYGEITGVSSHSVTVRTTRGESMTFETDSRSMLPARDVTGRRVKVEFHLMPNGTHHAGRVTVIEAGSFDWDRYDRELATFTTDEDETPLASNQNATAGDAGAYDSNRDNANTNDNVLRSDQDNRMGANTRSDAAETDRMASNTDESARSADELPRTASSRPLLLGVGLALLATGTVIGFRRRRGA